MKLQYESVASDLSSLLSVFCQLKADDGFTDEPVPALLPNIIVNLCGSASYIFADGRVRALPRVAVLGPTMSAFSMQAVAHHEIVCVGVTPMGWNLIFDVPADLLANDVVDATAIWGDGVVASLWSAVAGAPTLSSRRRVIELFLRKRMKEAGGRHDDARIVAVQRWLERMPASRLDELAGDLSLSWRQVERLTLRIAGGSPKAMAMKYRALHTAAILTLRGGAATRDAMSAYCDQSHLIRHFRRFVGCTPTRFLADRQELARATMQGRWDAGTRHTIAMLS